MVAVISARSDEGSPIAVRRIEAEDLDRALRQGWADFRALRGDILFVGLLYPAVGLLAAALALGTDLVAVVFPMAAAFSLLGPVAAIGFYALARRRAAGTDAGWRHFIEPLRAPNAGQIAGLAGAFLVLALAWLLTAQAIYAGTIGTLRPEGPEGFAAALFGTAEGWTMIVLGNIAGAGFAAVALVAGFISFPMLVDRPDAHALDAVITSLRASAANPTTVLRWGATVAVILAVASVPLFLGLAVALPVLGYASWHLYARVVDG